MKKELRIKVWNKYNGHCAYCGKEIEYEDMQVDHLIPKYHRWKDDEIKRHNNNVRSLKAANIQTTSRIIIRGTDNYNNLMPSCKRCNYHKAMLTVEEYRRTIIKKINVCNQITAYKIAKDYGLIKEIETPLISYFEKL